MVRTFSLGREDEREKPEQPDLFSSGNSVLSRPHGTEIKSSGINSFDTSAIATLKDAELIERLPISRMSECRDLCHEIQLRRLGDSAVPALRDLWRNFVGFGHDGPIMEQRYALETLSKTNSSMAREVLTEMSESVIPRALLPLVMRAIAAARASVSKKRVFEWMYDDRGGVRELAYKIAVFCLPPLSVSQIECGLMDPDLRVQRACRISIALMGDNRVKDALLAELGHNPKLAVILALIEILDDDIITHLRRCAIKHASFRAPIIDGLASDDSERAIRVSESLRNLL
ncbi:MAG: hypothetical protein OXC63_12030 [Aestuariivita sp.]|nr:hypothetical protein [Aestuariivita sp.]MCY4347803.1 hypothetical protein [Aestuariivita sp.]